MSDADEAGPEDGPQDPRALDVDARFARQPSRSASARLRYLQLRHPRTWILTGFTAALASAFALGPLATALFLLIHGWLHFRTYRPFALLAGGSFAEAEEAARDQLGDELPGPVSDELLTVAAAGRAAQGDLEAARELMAQREAPVGDLGGDPARTYRAVSAAAFEAAGAPELAADLLADIDPARDESPLVLHKASTLISAGRHRAAARCLEVATGRFTAPKVLASLRHLYLRLAMATWDPELEKLLADFTPSGADEQALALAGKRLLARLAGDVGQARACFSKLVALTPRGAIAPSSAYTAWLEHLDGALLGCHGMDLAALDQALAEADRLAEAVEPAERTELAPRWRRAFLGMARGALAGNRDEALLEGLDDEVLAPQGGLLRAARVLLLAGPFEAPRQAAAELMQLRVRHRESPACLAAAAVVRRLAGRDLDDEAAAALARGRAAAELFPPPAARVLREVG